jgi:DNA-binding response OmpR family regulator
MRVLLADPNALRRARLSADLGHCGFEVREAHDGQDVWFTVGRNLGLLEPDALVLDVDLPTLGGLELLIALRRAGKRIPVILLTSSASEEMRDRARRWGARAVLDWPHDSDTLTAALDYAVRPSECRLQVTLGAQGEGE